MRYEDLPPKLRAQADAKLGKKPREAKKSRGAIAGPCRYRCHACGQEFPAYENKGGAEEHSRETGHVRLDMVLQ